KPTNLGGSCCRKILATSLLRSARVCLRIARFRSTSTCSLSARTCPGEHSRAGSARKREWLPWRGSPMYASTAPASFWRRRRSRSKRSVASRVSARLRQFERRFTGASARRPRSIAPSSATSRRPVDPSHPEGDLYRDFHLVEAVDVRGARTPAVAVAVEVAVLELDSHSIGRL